MAETWETERLILRPLTMEDQDALLPIFRNRAVRRRLTAHYPNNPGEMQTYLRSALELWERFGFGLYAILLKEGGACIGCCGLTPFPYKDHVDGGLICVLARTSWGKGYATEFARAMIPYAFAHFPLERLYAVVYRDDKVSMRVLHKAGMTLVRMNWFALEFEVHRPPS